MILNKIDYKHNYFKHILHRDHVTISETSIVKDLSKLGRDLTKTIIVDNLEENFMKQPNNGLLIKSWNGNLNDTQLFDLIKVLKVIIASQPVDIREIIQFINKEIKSKLNASNNPYAEIIL